MSQQDGTQEPTLNASQERVTPEELAKAVAAVEARNDAETRQHNSTIPLGEAVRQLGLNATPEELLAEVRRQRARHEPPAAPSIRPNGRKDSPLPLFLGAMLAMLVFFGCTTLCLRRALDTAQSAVTSSEPTTAVLDTPDPPAQITIEAPTPAEAPAVDTEPEVDMMNTTPMPTEDSGISWSPLAKIPAEQDVNTDFESLHELANGKSQAAVQVAVDAPWDDKMWTLFKKDGQIFVHCFTSPSDAARAMNGRSSVVYASPQDNLIEVKLPIEAFKHAAFSDIPNHAGATVNK
jgi:hypothetical protein